MMLSSGLHSRSATGKKALSSGISLPIIPALPYWRQWLKYRQSCADGAGGRKIEQAVYKLTQRDTTI